MHIGADGKSDNVTTDLEVASTAISEPNNTEHASAIAETSGTYINRNL